VKGRGARREVVDGALSPVARELVLGDEIAELGFADWLAPERALVNVTTVDAHRRGAAKLRGPRDIVPAFFRMALLARDNATRR
jgi:hypothetical protein